MLWYYQGITKARLVWGAHHSVISPVRGGTSEELTGVGSAECAVAWGWC